MRILLLILSLSLIVGCASSAKSQKNAEVHFMLGVSYLRANDATQALREFLEAEKYDPDNAELQSALGQAYFLKGAFDLSEKYYLKSLKLDKGNPEFQNNLAALYMQLERWDDAISYFHKAASNLLFAQPEVAWTGHGYAYFMKGDYLTAIDSFGKAITQNWRYPQAYVRRGEALDALGKPAKAIIDYEQALKLYPNYVLAHYDLALANMKLRKVDVAIKHFNQVIKLRPKSELAQQSKSYLLVLE